MSLSITGSAFPQQDFNTAAAAGRSAVTTKSNEASTNSTQSTSKHNQPTALPAAPAPAKLTKEQQLEQLVALGDSNQQIATALGLTVTQVEQSLAGTSTAQSTASSVLAVAGRLSVKV